MSAVIPYIFLIVGLVLLYYGAEWLVDASAKLALRLGVKPLMVGLTIVAFGTSAPELVVSVQSALAGVGGISVGNVVGSNICNVALILGISALICPMLVSKQLFKFDIPVCLFASGLLWFFLKDGNMEIWEGIVLLVLFAGYIAWCVVNAKKSGDAGVDVEDDSGKQSSMARNVVFIIVGFALLVVGAYLLVKGAVEIATSWGVSEAVIGLTIVAIGTSLPELATSLVAAIKKHNDIAIGNIVGSNIFNILCILGVVGVMGPTDAKGIELRDILLLIALAVALLVPLITKRKMYRWMGAALFATYVVYIVILCSEVIKKSHETALVLLQTARVIS